MKRCVVPAAVIAVAVLCGCSKNETGNANAVDREEKIQQTARADDALQKLGEAKVLVEVPVRRIHNLVISPDETCLAVGGDDGKVYLYALPSGSPAGTLQGPYEEQYEDVAVTGLAFSPDGKHLLLGSVTTMWQLWDWKNKKKVREGFADEQADFVTWAPDGKQFATTAKRFQVQIFDAASGKSTKQFPGPTTWVRDALFTPDGKHLIAAGTGGIVFKWSVRDTGGISTPKPVPHEEIFDIALSPGGDTLATIGDKIHLWRMPDLRKQRTFEGDQAKGHWIAYTRDGKRLLTAGPAVVLWDAGTGRMLDRHEDKVPFTGGLALTRRHGILAGAQDRRVIVFAR